MFLTLEMKTGSLSVSVSRFCTRWFGGCVCVYGVQTVVQSIHTHTFSLHCFWNISPLHSTCPSPCICIPYRVTLYGVESRVESRVRTLSTLSLYSVLCCTVVRVPLTRTQSTQSTADARTSPDGFRQSPRGISRVPLAG